MSGISNIEEEMWDLEGKLHEKDLKACLLQVERVKVAIQEAIESQEDDEAEDD
jgi:hypothetical protein